jgi:D-3-phosphoglycerate dehydrogenase / 2-oxoglutarate reductase
MSAVTSYPKSKIRVLLLEKIHQSAIDLFQKEGFQVESREKLPENPSEAAELLQSVHILGIRSKTQADQRLLNSASKLMAIGAFCIGTDQTDLEYAGLKGVAVFNAPFANTRSVAELVLAEFICLARQLADRSQECHTGVWNKKSTNCYEIRGKTLCIIGYGHVGSQLSILAESMGMKVQFYDVVPKLALGLAQPCESMEEAIRDADLPETVNLIGEKELKWFKKGAYLINASRGQVVDLEPLAQALKEGRLGGAALDVFPYEPAAVGEEFKCPLQGLKNVILTPHIGGSTEEAQVAIGREVASKLISYINSGSTIGSVNFPEMSLPATPGTHRILNIHHNQPGFLRDMNTALSDYNISSQILMTRQKIGYMMIDVDQSMSEEIKGKVHDLKASIKTRILY